MKRSSPLGTQRTGQMPIYNRTHGHTRLASNGNEFSDISLPTIQKKEKVYLEKEIKSDDTLQSVALEFNVSVAELKRVNNIHKENEIYARKVIKVPSNTLSLLLEKEYFFQPNNAELDPGEGSSGTTTDGLVESVNQSSCMPRSASVSSTETNVNDQTSKYNFVPILSADVNDEENQTLLNNDGLRVTTEVPRDLLSCNGADWGISWPLLIGITLLLGFGVPLAYFLWALKKAEETPEPPS